jgi:hypothetical protein
MRTTVLIQIRGTMADAKDRLPEALAFVIPALRETAYGLVDGLVELEPPEVAELLCWGRERVAGKTLLRAACLYEHYDWAELDGSPMAELYHDFELFKPTVTGGEPPPLRNMASGFRGWWECGWCDRVRLEQVSPLKVRPASGIDVQLTDTKHLLLASRLAPLAEQAGAEIRVLAGRSDFVQVVTPHIVNLQPVFPLFQVSEPCPGCGRATYDRSDKIEGGLDFQKDDDLTVAKEWPLTLEVADAPAATCRDLIGWRGSPYVKGRHQVGAELDLKSNHAWAAGRYAVFLGRPFVDALLAQGASGLSLRPTNRIAPSNPTEADSPPAHGEE